MQGVAHAVIWIDQLAPADCLDMTHDGVPIQQRVEFHVPYRVGCRALVHDGLTDALEAVEHGTMQGTVYNDKENQARMIALLTVALFQGSDIEGYGLEDDIYYMSQYRKVDADNVDTFLGK
jgi:hypothetical protein